MSVTNHHPALNSSPAASEISFGLASYLMSLTPQALWVGAGIPLGASWLGMAS